MLGRVVCGLRTWMCTMAAPALAASMADCAICAGVTGTAGLRPGVSADPVTAHEIMTLRCIGVSSPRPCRFCSEPRNSMRGSTPSRVRSKRTSGMHSDIGLSHAQAHEWPVLPPFVHCAKARATRPWNYSDLCQGRFRQRLRQLGCGLGRLSGWGGAGRRSEPMNELLLDYLPLV